MATIKQINPNRANAQHSTGPRTAEGKSTSRLNALKSGINAKAEIVPIQSEDALNELTAQFQPAIPEEVSLVDLVVRNEWLLRRMAKVEGGYWEQRMIRQRTYDIPPERDILGKDYIRIQWRLNSIQRNLFEATDRLKPSKQLAKPKTLNHLCQDWLRSRVVRPNPSKTLNRVPTPGPRPPIPAAKPL